MKKSATSLYPGAIFGCMVVHILCGKHEGRKVYIEQDQRYINMKQFMSPEYANCSPWKAYKLLNAGVVKSVFFNGRRLVDRESAETLRAGIKVVGPHTLPKDRPHPSRGKTRKRA